MDPEKTATQQEQDTAADEGRELEGSQLEKLSGGVLYSDDPRDRDHKDKKDDPNNW